MPAAAVAIAFVGVLGLGGAPIDDPSRWLVRCGGAFQLCGHVDRQTDAQRIPFRYEAALPFRDGVAAVQIDGRWGYIDPAGEWVIQPTYEDASSFHGAYAEVRVGGASGVIDRSGRMVLGPQFKRIVPFAGEVFVASPLDAASRSGGRLGSEMDAARLTGFGDAGLYHLGQGWITDTGLQFTTFDADRDLIWAGRRNADLEEVWGLMRADGAWQVSPRYSYVQGLYGGRAIVRSLPDATRPRQERQESILHGAVDENGERVVPFERRWLGYWRAGYGLADRTGRASAPGEAGGEPHSGVVNPDGSLLGARYFDEVDVSESGLSPRGRIGDVWHSIAPDGRLLPDQRDGTVSLACPGGLSFIHRGSLVEVRRPGGEAVGLFSPGHLVPQTCPGPYSLRAGDRWFIVMPDGAILGGERGFDNLYGFYGGGAAVQLDGKWGVIDRSGGFTVPPRFDDLRPAAAGVYVTGRGDDAYWIDAFGRPVPEPQEPRPDPATALTCEGGLIRFRSNGRWGMQDAAGNTVIRPEHRVLSCFEKGSAWAVAPAGREWCPVGPDGERRMTFPCVQTVYPALLSHSRPEAFDEDPFENSVLWNLALLDYLAGDRSEAPRWVSTRTERR